MCVQRRAGLVCNALRNFLLCMGNRAGNTPVLMPHALSSTGTPSALSHVAPCLCAQAKNPGPAYPNFWGDLIAATSQVMT